MRIRLGQPRSGDRVEKGREGAWAKSVCQACLLTVGGEKGRAELGGANSFELSLSFSTISSSTTTQANRFYSNLAVLTSCYT